MRERQNVKKQFWCSREIAKELSRKALITNLSESEIIRLLIMNFEPQVKPPQEFYEIITELRKIGNNINQIARVANFTKIVQKDDYNKEVKKLNDLIIDLKYNFLVPKENKNLIIKKD